MAYLCWTGNSLGIFLIRVCVLEAVVGHFRHKIEHKTPPVHHRKVVSPAKHHLVEMAGKQLEIPLWYFHSVMIIAAVQET